MKRDEVEFEMMMKLMDNDCEYFYNGEYDKDLKEMKHRYLLVL